MSIINYIPTFRPREDRKILFLYLGGTAGSTRDESGALVPTLSGEGMLDLLAGGYPDFRKNFPYIDVINLMQKDSTDMTHEDRKLVVSTIKKNSDAYGAFVVQHGTDKLTNTVAYATLHLLGKAYPVIYTGAREPPESPRTDVLENLYGAFLAANSGFAMDGQEFGIIGDHVYFSGSLLWGIRAVKTGGRNYFESPYVIAEMEKGNLEMTPRGAVMQKEYGDRIARFLSVFGEREITYPDEILDWVGYRRLHEEFDPDELDEYVSRHHGIILEAWGEGGIEKSSRGKSVVDKLRRWTEDGKIVVVDSRVPFLDVDLTKYEVGLGALKNGAIPAFDMKADVALTKLRWAFGLTYRTEGGRIVPDVETAKKLMLYKLANEIKPRFNDLKRFVDISQLKMDENDFYIVLYNHILRNQEKSTDNGSGRRDDLKFAARSMLKDAHRLVGEADMPESELSAMIAKTERMVEAYAQQEGPERPSVLVVDDDHYVRRAANISLGAMGFDVFTAHDGKSALEIYDKKKMDFALIDEIMEGMGGTELAERIVEDNPEAKIYMMTGSEAKAEEIRKTGRRVLLKSRFDLAEMGEILLGKRPYEIE